MTMWRGLHNPDYHEESPAHHNEGETMIQEAWEVHCDAPGCRRHSKPFHSQEDAKESERYGEEWRQVWSRDEWGNDVLSVYCYEHVTVQGALRASVQRVRDVLGDVGK